MLDDIEVKAGEVWSYKGNKYTIEAIAVPTGDEDGYIVVYRRWHTNIRFYRQLDNFLSKFKYELAS